MRKMTFEQQLIALKARAEKEFRPESATLRAVNFVLYSLRLEQSNKTKLIRVK